MKIVQLIYSLTGGGAERFTVDLANKLAETNEVYLLLIVKHDAPGANFYFNDISSKVNVVNLGLDKGLTIKAFPKVINFIRKIKPDVINAHLNTIVYEFPLAFLFPKIKLFHTLHNPAEICIGINGQDFFNRFFYKYYIHPITISKLSDDSFKKYYGYDNSTLIDNGRSKPLTTSLFLQVKDEIEGYKLHSDDKVFIHVARCHEQKNQKMLIKCFNRLLLENKHAILLVCGGGFDSPLGIEIQNLKNREGIYFLGPKQNIADYLNCSDAFTLSSYWEGLPISLLEAMSYGLVPVVTPAGGIPSVIKDGVTGILSKDFSDDSFYNAMITYIERSTVISKEKIVKCYKENYSMDACAKKYLSLYQRDK